MGQSVVAIVVGEGVGEGGGEGGGWRGAQFVFAAAVHGAKFIVARNWPISSSPANRAASAQMVCVDVLPTRDDSAKAAAAYVAKVVRDVVAAKGGARVIFATGASQFEFLQHLVATEGLPWDKVEAFHLDEYVGLPITHGASFRGYLQERLFSEGVAADEGVNLLDPAELGAYEAALRAGPIDLACIGIGENGHLAFNDPPCVFDEEKCSSRSSTSPSRAASSRWARGGSPRSTRRRRRRRR